MLHAVRGIRANAAGDVRIALLGWWDYELAGQEAFRWIGVVTPRAELMRKLQDIREEVTAFRAAQEASIGGAPAKRSAQAKEIGRYTDAFEQELMVKLANELTDSLPLATGVFAWSIGKAAE